LVAYPAPGAADKLSAYIKSVWPALERMGIDDDASPDNYEFVGADLGEHISKCDSIQEVCITSDSIFLRSRILI
jgi:3-hydroxyacyl-CoA dehydrogenase